MSTVEAVFVHHTTQTNSYSCADSPAMVRSLHTYHVKSKGWKDLGYNFVVDKCGTVFEGRKGGVGRAVMAAHTYGFNRDTAGIAVTGMHTQTQATTAAITAVTRDEQLVLLDEGGGRGRLPADGDGGKPVATVKGTVTSAPATLALGKHSVQVRAAHQSGKVTTSAAATVVAEQTPPVFSAKPALTLRPGTVGTTAVPLTLTWKAADAAALKEVRLTAPVAKTYGATTGSASHTAKPGKTTVWKLTAYDRAVDTAAASVSGTPVILQESAAKKTGKWTTKSSSSYLGGKSYASEAKNASLTWTSTGRSAAWVVSRAATSGQAYV